MKSELLLEYLTMAPSRIVVDLDIGTDDALALLLLLHAEKLEKIKIEAIICTHGNTGLENVCKNLVRLLEIVKRTDIPIYKGCHQQILPLNTNFPPYHGRDGFGDLSHINEPNTSIIKSETSHVALYKIAKEHPGEISLICLGPLTNVAITMRMFEDFTAILKSIYIMGGNIYGVGNTTSAAEFNFFMDPEAASIVFECAKCPITLVPWESCNSSQITFNWRYEVLGNTGGAFWKLVDRAEKSVYGVPSKYTFWKPCDAFLVLVFLYPNEGIVSAQRKHVSIELHGKRTRGQVVLDHMEKNIQNTLIVEEINFDLFKEVVLKACKEL